MVGKGGTVVAYKKGSRYVMNDISPVGNVIHFSIKNNTYLNILRNRHNFQPPSRFGKKQIVGINSLISGPV